MMHPTQAASDRHRFVRIETDGFVFRSRCSCGDLGCPYRAGHRQTSELAYAQALAAFVGHRWKHGLKGVRTTE